MATDMQRKNFERREYVLALILSLPVAAADLMLIFATKWEKDRLEACHQAVQSIFLLTVVACTLTMCIRWYRQHDEMLEAMELSTELVQENEVAQCIREIVHNCREIQQKSSFGFVRQFLIDRLSDFNESIVKFRPGSTTVAINAARRHSPRFFKIKQGPSFVTALGDWGYWTTENGKNQLKGNHDAIHSENGPITRVLILPADNGAPFFPPDDLVRGQIEAGIELWLIHESEVDPEFRCDVGVFFEADPGKLAPEKVVFLSRWNQSAKSAELTFEGPGLKFGDHVRDYFSSHQRVRPIPDMEAFHEYKAATKRG